MTTVIPKLKITRGSARLLSEEEKQVCRHIICRRSRSSPLLGVVDTCRSLESPAAHQLGCWMPEAVSVGMELPWTPQGGGWQVEIIPGKLSSLTDGKHLQHTGDG